ncbi:uncharacterized protein LOC144156059 [Haemaphysalis longicornis]
MQLKPEAIPTIKSARRIPVALQEPVKAKLGEMERDGVIAKSQVRYMGYVLSPQGLHLDPDRVDDMTVPPPKNHRQLQSLKEATINDATFTDICRYVSRVASAQGPPTRRPSAVLELPRRATLRRLSAA